MGSAVPFRDFVPTGAGREGADTSDGVNWPLSDGANRPLSACVKLPLSECAKWPNEVAGFPQTPFACAYANPLVPYGVSNVESSGRGGEAGERPKGEPNGDDAYGDGGLLWRCRGAGGSCWLGE